MKQIYIGFMIMMMVLAGCQMKQEDVKISQLADHASIDQHKSDEAKQIVLSMKEVIEVKGVNQKNKIYLSPDVKHFDRFRLKEIRKNGHESVKKRFPEETVFLSTDKKIYMELDKLEKEIKEKNISEKQFEKRLKKLEEWMKG